MNDTATVTQTVKKGGNIALNAPVMITYPTALILATGLHALGLSALIAAFIVSLLVYALDWASNYEDFADDSMTYARRFVYVVVNTVILYLTVSGVISLQDLGLG